MTLAGAPIRRCARAPANPRRQRCAARSRAASADDNGGPAEKCFGWAGRPGRGVVARGIAAPLAAD